jgi:hypothetical protein
LLEAAPLTQGQLATAAGVRPKDLSGLARLVIDLLAPSYTGTHNPNRSIGDLVVDEIPGLSFASSAAPTVLSLTIELSSGGRREVVVPVPRPLPLLPPSGPASRPWSRLTSSDHERRARIACCGPGVDQAR